MHTHSTRLYRHLGWSACLALACGTQTSEPPSGPLASGSLASASPPLAAPTPSTSAGPSRTLAPPSPGAWRLVDPAALYNVMLNVSHILIRHRDVAPNQVSFDRADWAPSLPPPERTREQAFEVAQTVAEQARQRPETFASLAQRWSEDIATREQGGAFGAILAIAWLSWPEVLDALQSLRFGGVGGVVETDYGFHVFMLHPPLAPMTVSGAHIVIAYDEAPWLQGFLARGPIARRSREEAWARARAVYEQARREPERFEALVNEYSDIEDAARGGDFGAWSTRAPTPFPLLVRELAGLAVGELAPPLDSFLGVQVVKRTPLRPRARYAMDLIQLNFDPSLPAENAESGAKMLDILEGVAATLRREPARFDEFRAKYCCLGSVVWEEGQDSAIAERTVRRLALDQIELEPVRLNPGRYALVRRVTPPTVPSPATAFELPNPSEPDLTYFFALSSRMSTLPDVARQALADLHLPAELEPRFSELHADASRIALGQTGDEAVPTLEQLDTALRSLLGDAQFARYRQLVGDQVRAILLSPERVRQRPPLAG